MQAGHPSAGADARVGLGIGIVGATGALGTELLDVLGERHFPVARLLAVATEHSLGSEVELLGRSIPVQTEAPSLRGLDLLFLCLPPEPAREWIRRALHAEIPCVDLSGAGAATGELPLLAADLEPAAEALRAPLLALPPGPALAWALVLAPIHVRAGLRRVVGTHLESASGSGRPGLESLQEETLALLNQREAPEPRVFPAPIAFDVIPNVGVTGEEAGTGSEQALTRDLTRLLGLELPMAVTSVQVPTFAGAGASLAIETERPLAPEEAADLLAKATGVELRVAALPGPSLREPTGREVAIVGRIRRDPSCENGLLLFIASDPVRLAAANAVRLVEARLGHH